MKSQEPSTNEPFHYSGNVNISFACLKQTKKIVLHNKHNLIEKVNLFKIVENKTESIEFNNELEYDVEKDFLIVNLISECNTNSSYVLEIFYLGYLDDSMSGFYLSNYKDSQGKDHYVALTQFEPTDARKAFPCFDEPAMKAEFKISILRHQNFSSVSNMPLVNTEKVIDEDG